MQQVAVAVLLGLQRHPVERFDARQRVVLGQSETPAAFPGTQDQRIDHARRQFATFEKCLPRLAQARAVQAGHHLYLSHLVSPPSPDAFLCAVVS
ncbi:hypothetical protein SDC9_178859 [bioreactor metagenome]|uniref:Uncharacterized protein n=1 Tax=bioreactor metagenome TaxID=1076179 RepID=A0A645GX48_9ZZZZ